MNHGCDQNFVQRGARIFAHKVMFKLFNNISADHLLYPGLKYF
jgi:hypothetical protein